VEVRSKLAPRHASTETVSMIMAVPITTEGMSGGSISTSYQPTESTRDWVSRHTDALVASSRPAGNKLTTTWESATGPKSIFTDREAGESDEDFTHRHILAFMLVMLENPPVI
jgi:hypothetical protein